MAQGFAAELVGVLDGTLTTPGKSDGRVQGGNMRAFCATLDMALAAVAKASGDTNVLARIPAGYKPLYLVLTASATMGAAATLALGNATTAGKYRAAAVFTAVDTPTITMLSSAADDAPLTASEDVLLTIGTAALPGAGVLNVVIVCAGR